VEVLDHPHPVIGIHRAADPASGPVSPQHRFPPIRMCPRPTGKREDHTGWKKRKDSIGGTHLAETGADLKTPSECRKAWLSKA
jgi:hypothetical protein